MAYRLGGRNSLPYLGVEAPTPANTVLNKRSPTSTDSQNFNIGTFWLKTDAHNEAQEVWILISLSGGVATWVQLYPTGGGGASEFPTDSGTANELAGVLNVFGGAGSGGFININTKGSGNTVDIILNDYIQWPNSVSGLTEGSIWLGGTHFMHNLGTFSTFLGEAAGPLINSSTGNSGIGYLSLSAITTGENNSALGRSSGVALTTGNTNLLLGDLAGSDYTTESNNICLANFGTVADSGVMRIGTSGTQNSCYLAGTYSTNISTNSPKMLIQNNTDLVGTGTITSSDGSIAINFSPGSVDFTIPGDGGGAQGKSFLAYVNPNEILPSSSSPRIENVGNYQAMVVDYDNFGAFNPGPVAGGATFTAPITGYYLFSYSVALTGNWPGTSLGEGVIFKNGTPFAASATRTYTASTFTANSSGSMVATVSMSLTSGDVITFGALLNVSSGVPVAFIGVTSAGLLNGSKNTWISGTLLKTA